MSPHFIGILKLLIHATRLSLIKPAFSRLICLPEHSGKLRDDTAIGHDRDIGDPSFLQHRHVHNTSLKDGINTRNINDKSPNQQYF